MRYSGLDVLTIVHFGILYVFGFGMRNSGCRSVLFTPCESTDLLQFLFTMLSATDAEYLQTIHHLTSPSSPFYVSFPYKS